MAALPIILKARSFAREVADRFTTHTSRFYAWLDKEIFPKVVGFVTQPLTILATMGLLIPLVVLLSNSYLNVCSAAVSSIVLATSLKHQHENKQLHARHAADVTALHAKIDALTPKPRVRKPAQKEPTP